MEPWSRGFLGRDRKISTIGMGGSDIQAAGTNFHSFLRESGLVVGMVRNGFSDAQTISTLDESMCRPQLVQIIGTRGDGEL